MGWTDLLLQLLKLLLLVLPSVLVCMKTKYTLQTTLPARSLNESSDLHEPSPSCYTRASVSRPKNSPRKIHGILT